MTGGRKTYRVFDLVLESEFALPLRPVSSAVPPDLYIQLRPGTIFAEGQFEWFHEWKSLDNSIVIAAAKSEDGYLLRFPGCADFYLCLAENAIRVLPMGNVDDSTLAHLLLDQVIPRWQSHRGRLVVHASSVELSSGAVVGFLGASGSGKSTLVSSFHVSGARVISDDCLCFQTKGDRVFAVPPYVSLRLWEDSLKFFFPEKNDFERMAYYTSKQQMIMEKGAQLDRCEPEPLTALFVLERSEASQRDDEIRIFPATGNLAAMSIIESAFVLDLSREGEAQRNFKTIGKILAAGLPVFRLSYARKYCQLPRVRDAIRKFADGLPV